MLAHSRSLVLLKAYVCRCRAGFWIKARVRRTKQCGACSQGPCSVTGEPSSRCITQAAPSATWGKCAPAPPDLGQGRGDGEWGPERPPGSVCRGPVGRESPKRAALSGWPLCSSAFGAYLGSVARNGIIDGSCPSCLLEEIRAEKKSVQQCKHPCTQWCRTVPVSWLAALPARPAPKHLPSLTCHLLSHRCHCPRDNRLGLWCFLWVPRG